MGCKAKYIAAWKKRQAAIFARCMKSKRCKRRYLRRKRIQAAWKQPNALLKATKELARKVARNASHSISIAKSKRAKCMKDSACRKRAILAWKKKIQAWKEGKR